MKRFIEGEDRTQITLLPECLDDYVGEDNPVRVVEVFVDELDLEVELLRDGGVIPAIHVHLSVRAEGRDGKRLNPRKEDLRRWRETFAERLRGWGIEAEASSQATRGTRHRNERVWERKTVLAREPRATKAEPLPSGTRKHALQAWVEITRALAASPDSSDRKLAKSIHDYLERLPAVQAIVRERERQRELPGMSRSTVEPSPQQRRGPEIERWVRATRGCPRRRTGSGAGRSRARARARERVGAARRVKGALVPGCARP